MPQNIFFTSPEHKSRFLTAIQQRGRVWENGHLDQEYGAAFYILTAESGTWKKASDYIDDDGIDFEAMLHEVDFSSGSTVLIKLAGNLFNGHQHIDPLEFMRLDQGNFNVALTAVQLRRYPLHINTFQERG